jgi:hydroxypyruvate reductase
MTDPKTLLADLFRAAMAAADPCRIVPRHLPARPKGRTIVVGAGKASALMALAFEEA